jgi:hypothetical protein
MSHHNAATSRSPRTDNRPLWEGIRGAYGYLVVLLAHRRKLYPLLAEKPLATRPQERSSARRREEPRRMGSPWRVF